jgi:hypothetical protein
MTILGGHGRDTLWGSSPRTTAAVAYTAAPGGSVATKDIATIGIAIVKGETPAADWALVTFSAGGSRKVAVQVVIDLPHLVVESVFGIDDGRWGTLAATCAPENDRAPDTSRAPGAGVPGHCVAAAAVDAVVNRWRRGPDTPQGVRDRLRARAKRETWLAARIAELADALDDAEIRAAGDGVQAACRQWARLPVGGALRLTWPMRF